jgi:uncharacterized protein
MKSIQSKNFSFHFVRLTPDQDLRQSLETFCKDNRITAGSIVSGVGSLKKIKLRKANSDTFYESQEPHEIVTISGLVSRDGLHVHLSIADKNAQIFGGHLSEGNLIFTTVELVIASYLDIQFHRELDPATGFRELAIRKL